MCMNEPRSPHSTVRSPSADSIAASLIPVPIVVTGSARWASNLGESGADSKTTTSLLIDGSTPALQEITTTASSSPSPVRSPVSTATRSTRVGPAPSSLALPSESVTPELVPWNPSHTSGGRVSFA